MGGMFDSPLHKQIGKKILGNRAAEVGEAMTTQARAKAQPGVLKMQEHATQGLKDQKISIDGTRGSQLGKTAVPKIHGASGRQKLG